MTELTDAELDYAAGVIRDLISQRPALEGLPDEERALLKYILSEMKHVAALPLMRAEKRLAPLAVLLLQRMLGLTT